MKRFLLATAAGGLLAASASAQETANVGIIFGFTGPIESLTPNMAASTELAFKEANDSGLLPVTINPIRGDSTCVDAAAATPVAERMVTSDNVVAIVGGDCSGVTMAIVNNIAVPNGVPTVSPSATSPALSTIEDNDFFIRTSPSDARQGEVLAMVLADRGITEVAVTFTNNDYGKGLAEAFQAAFTAGGGTVMLSAPHEDGKADYSAEVAALQATGAEHLAVLGYVDQGGRGIVQASLDTGAFESFIFGDGMHGQSIIDAIGEELDGKVVGVVPGSESEGRALFAGLAEEAGFDASSSYTGESYDAGALIALAIAAGGSADRTAIRDHLIEVANAPGEPVLPGELAKGIQILLDGGDVDYSGATDVELIGPGEAAGAYREYEIAEGHYNYIGVR
jgi:branched-chain amino acid transport system substrate-binding protein